MSEPECKQCGLALPQKACFCRQCGTPVGSSRSEIRAMLGGAAWTSGVLIWIISGVVMAVAGAEHWEGLAAGAGFLFSILSLVGLVAAGMMKSPGGEGKPQ